MLIINISKIKVLPRSFEGGKLIDITNSIDYSHKINLNVFINQDELYTKALNEYQKFIVQLAQNQQLQKYYVKDLQLYWLSDVAGKHPINHWGKDFFLLFQIVKQSIKTIKQYNKLVLLLPSDLRCVESSIAILFKKYGCDLPLEFLYSTQNKNVGTLDVLRKTLNNLKSILNYKQSSKSVKSTSKNYFLINHLENQHTLNKQYYPLKKIFNENKGQIDIIPLLEWRKRKIVSENINQDYYLSKPNLIQLLKISLSIFKTYFTVKQQETRVEIEGVDFLFNNFSEDIKKILFVKNDFIFMHFWLVNFFKKDHGQNTYIYEDEFYDFGKTISSAANSVQVNVKTRGIQHGNFNEIHTVYTITDTEIEKGLPIPDKFIVWGKYYQDIVQQNNSLPNSYFLPLGSPNYINTNSNRNIKDSFNAVLWCLTTYECFKAEWEIIKNATWLNNKQLIIRLHPLAHISAKQVNNILTNFNFIISTETNIENDFSRVDFVMTSAHSTVFVDALAFKLPVLRLVSNRWIGNSDGNSKYCFIVRKPEDVTNFMSENTFQTIQEDNFEKNYILELNCNQWYNFLTQNDNR